MTIEETIYALDIVEHMESFSVLYEPGEPMNQTTVGKLKEACRMAVSILHAREGAPPNDPLTLKELRGMVGEPVWGAFPDGRDRYMIVQWHNSEFFKTFECGFLLVEEYGETWLVYRRKPEEGTK